MEVVRGLSSDGGCMRGEYFLRKTIRVKQSLKKEKKISSPSPKEPRRGVAVGGPEVARWRKQVTQGIQEERRDCMVN
jgi:hypothetical protein